jgi:peptidoglycan/xylan/chitin deacetylase (PgdA/CDA1 family)
VHDRLRWSRRLVKTALARMLGPFLPADRLLIVGYHRVVERFDWEARRALKGSLVSRAMFERHLDWIGRTHQFVSLDDIGNHFTAGAGNGRRPLAAVTFDDGYQDVYENAFPLLVHKGIPATMFVVTDLIDTLGIQTHDELYALLSRAIEVWRNPVAALKERLARAAISDGRRVRLSPAAGATALTRALLTSLSRDSLLRVIQELRAELNVDAETAGCPHALTWDMVTDMHQAGMTIGSHTRSHVLLTNESRDRVFEEVASSRHELERRLGQPVQHLAYPDGRFDGVALQAVRAAGYRFAYTACGHRDSQQPFLTIPRRMLWEQSAVNTAGEFLPALLRCQEHGWLTGQGDCTRQSHA